MSQIYFNIRNEFLFALSVSVVLFLPLSMFSQGVVVGYADGNKRVNANNVTSFPSNAQLDRLTHVIAVGLGVNSPLGTLKKSDLPGNWNGNTNTWLASLVSRANQKGVKVSVCITGRSEFNSATSTQHKINTFVNEIVSFINAHGLDGVDINWEYPGFDSDLNPLPKIEDRKKEWNQCITLLHSLKLALPNKRISMALPVAHPANPNFYPNQTSPTLPIPRQIWNIVDAIQLMTYDEDGWPTHSDANNAIAHINHWATWNTTNGNLCKGNLFLGSAFYGYSKDSNGNTLWNGNKVSYATYSGGGNYNRGDLPADVRNKAIHTRNNGFGGVFIWELGYDVPANQSNSLLKAIHEVMPYVSGSSNVCNTNTTFTLHNRPNGSTISWSKSNNLAYVNGQGTGDYIIKAATSSTSGNGWVEATVSSPCGNTPYRINLWVGKPTLPTVNPSKGIQMTISDDLRLVLTNTPGASSSSGQWSASGVLYPTYSEYTTGVECFFSANVPGPGTAMVTTSNVCGSSPIKYIYVLVQDIGGGNGGGPLTIAPNPASNEINLIFDEQQNNSENNISHDVEMNYSVRIVNNFGLVFYSGNMNSKSMKINISNWEKGFYHVFITNNDNSFSRTFIVN